VVEKYLELSSLPVLFKPNAGLPKAKDGVTVYDVSPLEFASDVSSLVEKGVRAVGGCCGTTPEYIGKTVEACRKIEPKAIEKKNITCVSSYTHAVEFGKTPLLIGERINPTGKKRFKQALISRDVGYILNEGIAEEERGVHILDVNVGLPEIDEVEMLVLAVTELQAIIDLPLQIDTSNPDAMEAALRIYNGKAMINSVNGKKESMERVFPLAKKYGGVIVALTLDESGIPATAEGRVEIAKRILAEAERYGIEKKDIVFDPLALTVSADSSAASETLRAVEIITKELGCYTSLGVSNVSFGLPHRDAVNSSYFTMALSKGLSAAIMNPYSQEMMKAYYSYKALVGLDENCREYIAFCDTVAEASPTTAVKQAADFSKDEYASALQRAIVKGLKDEAAELTRGLLSEALPLDIVKEHIIPALDTVGVGFEKKTVYLPQLLMSAEAAKAAFEVIKANMPEGRSADRCEIVLATVKGDIHDIGKNIVKLILENYGFRVIDLGKDVSPEAISLEVVKRKAVIVGLSALMTTTVPAMEATVKLLKKNAPWCRVMVGGAVLTPEYAEAIGADRYGKDAMDAVRIAEEIEEELRKNGN